MIEKNAVIDNLVEMGHFMTLFGKKIFVIKYGGSIMTAQKEKEAFIEDVIFMNRMGIKIVIVHGGGQFISTRLEQLGIETEFLEGYRVTDDVSIKEVEMLLSGHLNKDLTMLFNNKGIKAVGLNGKDGGLLLAKKKKLFKNGEELNVGNVGEVEIVDPSYLHLLLENNYLPIISPIGFDKAGVTYNINADDVAAEICVALGAEKLLLMTDVKGVYETFGDEGTFLSTLSLQEAKDLIDTGVIKEGMLPKLKSCITSLEKGTKSAHIISGMIEHSLLTEVFSNEGSGTMLV